jgi:hypothetical protein
LEEHQLPKAARYQTKDDGTGKMVALPPEEQIGKILLLAIGIANVGLERVDAIVSQTSEKGQEFKRKNENQDQPELEERNVGKQQWYLSNIGRKAPMFHKFPYLVWLQKMLVANTAELLDCDEAIFFPGHGLGDDAQAAEYYGDASI